MDFEVQRCTRKCAATGRELAPGEAFYSVLVAEGSNTIRKDYCLDGWEKPSEGNVDWWKSYMPMPEAKRMHWAPNEVMLHYFEQLGEQPHKEDVRYVLSLLLVRRRVMRLEESDQDDQGRPVMVLFCPRRNTSYRVVEVSPEESRIEEIQEELAKLLFAKGE